jgi:nucleoside phosphorylase
MNSPLAAPAYSPPVGRIGHAIVAIVTILDEEFAAVSTAFGSSELDGGRYHTVGQTDDRQWDVVIGQSSERSNIPCTSFVGEIIEDFRPQVLLLVGIGGGLCDDGTGRDGVNLGDVVIADSVTYVEFAKITEKGVFLRQFVVDQPSLHLKTGISQPLTRRFDLHKTLTMEAPDATRAPKVMLGQLVSGEKVMSGVDNVVQVELLRPFDKAVVVDMESIGMARMVCERRTSFWYNPRYAVIRGISDLVGSKDNNEMRERWRRFAAHTAALVAVEFVRRFVVR